MEFRLITAPPGLRKDRVVDKIRVHVGRLKINGHQAVVGVGDIEEKLKEVCPPDLYFPDSNQDTLALILSQVLQEKVRELWKKALLLALKEATQAQPSTGKKPDLAIIVTSLCYYRKQTFEFYCPVDPKFLAELQRDGTMPQVGSILTLIDDIYDVYYRLSREGHVFSIRQLVEGELQKNEGSESERYKRALGLVIQSLIRVLEWRESEIQASAALAASLGCDSFTLAVKHPVETAVRLLLRDACENFGLGRSIPVYLSHPISAPRRENARTGEWPSFVNEFDHFVRQVRLHADEAVHVVPIMPTAIDEYRFLKDGERLLPRLAPRWPLPNKDNDGNPEELLYSATEESDSYEEYEASSLKKIFDPPLDREGRHVGLPNCDEHVKGVLIGDSEISGMLRTLEAVIGLQLANRDHLLVRQCPGLLLYRPTFEEPPRFTGGVCAEIMDQHNLRKFDREQRSYGRPMAFVHCRNDLERMFTSGTRFTEDAVDRLKDTAKRILSDREDTGVGTLEDQLVVPAMTTPGDPSDHVPAIHESLFRPVSASIGLLEPPSLDATKKKLAWTIVEERVRNLCNGRPSTGWQWEYSYLAPGGDCLFRESNIEQGEPVLLASVVDNLQGSCEQRIAVAELVCKHFADRMRNPGIDVPQ